MTVKIAGSILSPLWSDVVNTADLHAYLHVIITVIVVLVPESFIICKISPQKTARRS